MMKRLIYIIFMVSSLYSYAQMGATQEAPPENRFKQSEQAAQNNADALPGAVQDDPFDSGGGNPGPPEPIDGPLPLLGIAAVAIIVYTVYRRKNITA